MSTKLHTIVALVGGKKAKAQEVLTKAYHLIQKAEPLAGLRRVYQPKDEEGEKLPSESKRVQIRISDILDALKTELSGLYDTVMALDTTNCHARGDIMVDDQLLVSRVPVTTLLFLEKRLVDLHTFVSKLPTLDPAKDWKFNEGLGLYEASPVQTVKTKKVPRNHIKAEATKEHPAQVELFNEDVTIGYWTLTEYSGAILESDQKSMLARIRKLQDAVKVAREDANTAEVPVVPKLAEPLFDYVLNGKT